MRFISLPPVGLFDGPSDLAVTTVDVVVTSGFAILADCRSALTLVAVRLRHVASTHWDTRKYLDRPKERDQEKA
jgi:hypothetical protein